jgi:hypothetical protein
MWRGWLSGDCIVGPHGARWTQLLQRQSQLPMETIHSLGGCPGTPLVPAEVLGSGGLMTGLGQSGVLCWGGTDSGSCLGSTPPNLSFFSSLSLAPPQFLSSLLFSLQMPHCRLLKEPQTCFPPGIPKHLLSETSGQLPLPTPQGSP